VLGNEYGRTLPVCMDILDYREDDEVVPAYLARGADRLYKALREWADDPDLRKVSHQLFLIKLHLSIIICCEKSDPSPPL